MRDITLEILRKGPAHNQLLSPLTEYLVLCANRPAQPLRLTFEHREFLAYLEALRYGEDETRPSGHRTDLTPVQELISEIVNGFGGLGEEAGVTDGQWAHLRLILSPTELSLLPFELAKCPDNFPGSELPLVLNHNVPIVMTREIRQIRSRAFAWPVHPRVLVATTDLPGSPVPTRAHLLVIRKALEPWIGPASADHQRSIPWTVIERASTGKILEACKKHKYTHIHVLAHGAEIDTDSGRGYGLALHDESGHGSKVVTGNELAELVGQPPRSGELGSAHVPAVIVLASCDSGASPDVVYTGASTAQQLHGAGVPMVIASQYPLSKIGSVVMAKELYPRLFRCEDPRRALYDARLALKAEVSSTHDWASLVAYAALPDDVGQQLEAARIERSLTLLTAARKWREWGEQHDDVQNTASGTADDRAERGAREWRTRLDSAAQIMKGDMRRVETAPEALRAKFAEACGQLGVEFKFGAEKAWDVDDLNRCRTLLEDSQQWYEIGHSERMLAGEWAIPHWNATQHLCLSAVLNGHLIGMNNVWLRARASAHAKLYAQNLNDQLWAMGSLAELWMLRPLTDPSPPPDFWDIGQTRAKEHIADFKKWSAEDSEHRKSMRRQLVRYTKWWGKIPDVSSFFRRVVATADKLVKQMDSPNDEGDEE